MNIHEYQTKDILRKYGIKVPPYRTISTLSDVEKALDEMGLDKAVLKVQVHAGGRGKAGGVKLAKNREEILSHAKKMLGMKIITNQTGKEGIVAHQLLLSPIIDFKKEYYVGAIIDRKKARALLIISPDGGVEIEEIAAKSPERIKTMPIHLDGKLKGYQLIELVKFMGWTGETANQGKKLLASLAKAFMETDASLLEINPLVETETGDLLALDAKLSVDENALYRQVEIAGFFDPTQLSQYEVLAKRQELAYVALDGEIGCMVNGAGLAMATMDIIHHYGGKPANFLDVGGGATQEKVAEGFKIILSDPQVKAILVNIFGGIMNCVTLAGGIIAAAAELEIRVPLIVRMEGTNVEQGKKMLAESGLNITIANSLAEAAQKVVEASKQRK